MHTREVWGHGPPEKIRCSEITSEAYHNYLYPNVTNPTRVQGGSNTTVRHNTCQSSRGVSVTV